MSVQYVHNNHQSELHVSQMTKHVADAEAELHQTQEEKQMVLEDLRAVRDLCAKLEMSKDSLQRQLTNKALEIEKVYNPIDTSIECTDYKSDKCLVLHLCIQKCKYVITLTHTCSRSYVQEMHFFNSCTIFCIYVCSILNKLNSWIKV